MLTREQRRWVRRLHRALPMLRFRVCNATAAQIAAIPGAEWEDAGVAIGGRVLIRSNLPALSWKDALLHEVAHVAAPLGPDHGATWGKAFARVYRCFYGVR